jgi:dihydrofolate reductase
MIGMIAAVTQNGVIGVENKLPFDYPADMKHFRTTTANSIVIMGRKTFEGIGKPLPKRRNIIITRDKNLPFIDIEIASSVKEAIDMTSGTTKDIWFIGGAAIYEAGMEFADKIVLTITPDIELRTPAVKFPWISPVKFKIFEKRQLVPGKDDLNLVTYKKIIDTNYDEEQPYYVYAVVNNINNKIYIGKATNPQKRWKKHIWISQQNSNEEPQFSLIHSAIKKYGEKNFTFKIVCDCQSEAHALEMEKYFILELKMTHQLYNLTDGGQGSSGFKHSSETIQKMSSMRQGELSGRAKLSLDDVNNIRTLLQENNLSHKEIANKFNISVTTISDIKNGRSWNN